MLIRLLLYAVGCVVCKLYLNAKKKLSSLKPIKPIEISEKKIKAKIAEVSGEEA